MVDNPSSVNTPGISSSDPKSPRIRLGPYEISEWLGRGGASDIFLALDTEHSPNRWVVIKRLRKDAKDHPLLATGFANEQRLLKGMKHPNILQHFTDGEVDDLPYLVAQFIDGQNLRVLAKRITREANMLTLLPFLISEILAGVAYIHQVEDEEGRVLGLVHGDLTPTNILVGYNGQVVIADFGAARISTESRREASATAVLGTLSYIAPEIFKGEKIDPRSDIYSVGAMLYELAVGRPPFCPEEGETEEALIERVTQGRFLSPQEARPSLSDALSQVIEKALSTHPKKRFGSAKEMADALKVSAPNEKSQNRELRQFLLGSAMIHLFGQEYQKTASRRQPVK